MNKDLKSEQNNPLEQIDREGLWEYTEYYSPSGSSIFKCYIETKGDKLYLYQNVVYTNNGPILASSKPTVYTLKKGTNNVYVISFTSYLEFKSSKVFSLHYNFYKSPHRVTKTKQLNLNKEVWKTSNLKYRYVAYSDGSLNTASITYKTCGNAPTTTNDVFIKYHPLRYKNAKGDIITVVDGSSIALWKHKNNNSCIEEVAHSTSLKFFNPEGTWLKYDWDKSKRVVISNLKNGIIFGEKTYLQDEPNKYKATNWEIKFVSKNEGYLDSPYDMHGLYPLKRSKSKLKK